MKRAPYNNRTKHPLHITWQSMRQRCRPSSYQDPCYAAKATRVCKRWDNLFDGFDNFVKDMGPKPTPKHSIDRINTYGDYSPENCRWATPFEQANNRVDNAEVPGVTHHSSSGKWLVRLQVDGVRRYLGIFNNHEDAVRVRVEAMNGNWTKYNKETV